MNADEIEILAREIAQIRRETVRPVLDQIVAELEREMRAAGLIFPVSIGVPASGTAIVTLFTQGDPPILEFDKAADILCGIVGRHLGTTFDHREPISMPVAAESTAGC